MGWRSTYETNNSEAKAVSSEFEQRARSSELNSLAWSRLKSSSRYRTGSTHAQSWFKSLPDPIVIVSLKKKQQHKMYATQYMK